MVCRALLLVDGVPVCCLTLPASVDLVITETDPSIKGGIGHSARTKPAALSTGLIVQVPEHISTGDKIKVNASEL